MSAPVNRFAVGSKHFRRPRPLLLAEGNRRGGRPDLKEFLEDRRRAAETAEAASLGGGGRAAASDLCGSSQGLTQNAKEVPAIRETRCLKDLRNRTTSRYRGAQSCQAIVPPARSILQPFAVSFWTYSKLCAPSTNTKSIPPSKGVGSNVAESWR